MNGAPGSTHFPPLGMSPTQAKALVWATCRLKCFESSQEQLDLSNGYVPFRIAISFGSYHDSILNVLAHLQNFKIVWEITIPRKLILEMSQLSVSIYTPNLQVR